jgi:hypothetical protein
MSDREWLFLFLGIVIGYFLFRPKKLRHQESPKEEFVPITVTNPPTTPGP